MGKKAVTDNKVQMPLDDLISHIDALQERLETAKKQLTSGKSLLRPMLEKVPGRKTLVGNVQAFLYDQHPRTWNLDALREKLGPKLFKDLCPPSVDSKAMEKRMKGDKFFAARMKNCYRTAKKTCTKVQRVSDEQVEKLMQEWESEGWVKPE